MGNVRIKEDGTIYIALNIAGALFAAFAFSLGASYSAKKAVVEETIDTFKDTLKGSDLADLKDIRKSIRKSSTIIRVITAFFWWSGVAMYGISLYMLA